MKNLEVEIKNKGNRRIFTIEVPDNIPIKEIDKILKETAEKYNERILE